MDSKRQYALLLQAVREDPPCPSGLKALLQIVTDQQWDVDLNAYLRTSKGYFSLPAILLANSRSDSCGNAVSTVIPALRMLFV